MQQLTKRKSTRQRQWQRQQQQRPRRFGMLNAVRTKHSVYVVVGNSSSRQTEALTVAEEEEAAALSSNVHLGKYCKQPPALQHSQFNLVSIGLSSLFRFQGKLKTLIGQC